MVEEEELSKNSTCSADAMMKNKMLMTDSPMNGSDMNYMKNENSIIESNNNSYKNDDNIATTNSETATRTRKGTTTHRCQYYVFLLCIIRCIRTVSNYSQPILISYYTMECSLHPSSILFITSSLYSWFVSILEIPSGILSDYYQRPSLLLMFSFICFGTSLVITSLISSFSSTYGNNNNDDNFSFFPLILLGVSQLIRAIGSSLFSGTDMTLLYDILQIYDDENDKTKSDHKEEGEKSSGNEIKKNNKSSKESLILSIESRHIFCVTVTEALVSALGGYNMSSSSQMNNNNNNISKHSLQWIVFVSAIPYFIPGAILCRYVDLSMMTTKKKQQQQQAKEKAIITAKNNDDNNNKRASMSEITTTTTTKISNSKNHSKEKSSDNTRKNDNINIRSSSSFQLNLKNNKLIIVIQSKFQSVLSYLKNTIKTAFATLWSTSSSSTAEGDNNNNKLRKLFVIGIVLNCGTYIATTALHPLLYENFTEIPISYYGILHATNSIISAFSSLLAPTVRNQFTKLIKRICKKKKKKSMNITTTNDDDDNDGTRNLLFLLLGISIIAYGLMTTAAAGAANSSATVISKATTTTASSFSSYDKHNSNDNDDTLSFDIAKLPPNTIAVIISSWLLSWVRGMAWPTLGAAINSAATTKNRALILSLFAGSIKVGMVVTGLIMGLILRRTTSTKEQESSNGGGGGLWESCAFFNLVLIGTFTYYFTNTNMSKK